MVATAGLTFRKQYLLDADASHSNQYASWRSNNSFPPPADPEPSVIRFTGRSNLLSPGFAPPPSAPTQAVSYRTAWADEWTEVPFLHCDEATWCANPALPTATLSWRYGTIQQRGRFSTAIYNPERNVYRAYIKVVFTFDDPSGTECTRTWIGILEVDENRMGGTREYWPDVIATGEQTFTAYGLEKLLNENDIDRCYWYDVPALETQTSERLPDFNARGEQNQHLVEVDNYPLFAYLPEWGKHWSTWEIVQYLVYRLAPKDADDVDQVPFSFNHARGLWDLSWDRPTVSQTGRTVFEILQELVHRRRLISAWWIVDEDVDFVRLNTNTLVQEAVSIPHNGASHVPANNRQRQLDFEQDPYTTAAIKISDVRTLDQVVCRGDLIYCVGNFSIADVTLEEGWTATTEASYVTAASGQANYTDWTLAEKRSRNRVFRRDQRFADVFSLYVIDYSWGRTVGDGEGGDKEPLFPETTDPQPIYQEMFVQPDLPLLAGVDYTDEKIEDDDVDESPNTDGERLPPLCFIKQPNTSPAKWVRGDQWGEIAEWSADPSDQHHWSVDVQVPPNSHGVRLVVQGEDQHVLDGAAFDLQKLPVDAEPGGVDPSDGMILVLSLPAGRYVEGKWPPNPDADYDVCRKRVIDMGDDFTATYVAPNTVVGVDESGALQRTTGGWIPKRADTDDNFRRLQGLAKTLHAYYSKRRYVLNLTSHRFFSEDDLMIGDLITAVGRTEGRGHYQEINSFLSQITFRHPQGKGDDRPAPTMHLTTWAGEQDPIKPRPYRPDK